MMPCRRGVLCPLNILLCSEPILLWRWDLGWRIPLFLSLNKWCIGFARYVLWSLALNLYKFAILFVFDFKRHLWTFTVLNRLLFLRINCAQSMCLIVPLRHSWLKDDGRLLCEFLTFFEGNQLYIYFVNILSITCRFCNSCIPIPGVFHFAKINQQLFVLCLLLFIFFIFPFLVLFF